MKHLLRGFALYCFLNATHCFGNKATDDLFAYVNQINSGNITINVEDANKYIDLLVERGAELNVHDKKNMTPLMIVAASKVKHAEAVIERLVIRGADKNARNHQRKTALFWAMSMENLECVKKLIKLGAKVPIHELFRRFYHEELVELLVPYCDNLQERDVVGDSLLHMVVAYSSVLTKLLVKHKVDAHIRNSRNGRSVLHAALNHYYENEDENDESLLHQKKLIIDYLLDKGLSINAEDNHGATPLHGLVQVDMRKNVKQAMIEYVIMLGADPLKKDHNGLSSVHYAMHANNTEITDALMAAIAKYQPRNVDAARAELVEDIDEIEQAIQRRNWIQTILSFGYQCGLNVFAGIGVFAGIQMLRKQKVH